jgi:hypothetical protein
MPPKTEYFANFEGDEINGKFYALGDTIADDVDVGTLGFLESTGRIGATKPDTANGFVPLTLDDKPLDRMTRAELEAAAMATIDLSRYSDDELRSQVEGHRAGPDAADDDEESESMTSTTGGEKPPFDPAAILAGTIPDVETRLGDISDVAQLDELETTEVAGQGRTGVGAAIKKRREALQSA